MEAKSGGWHFPLSSTTNMAGLLLLVTCICGQQSLPLWKMQLINYTDWNGNYLYRERSYACSLKILSVQPDRNRGASLTFKANSTHFDMLATSIDDVWVTFRTEASYQSSEHFFGSDGFEFHATMVPSGNLYYLSGNITKPNGTDFRDIYFRPQAGSKFRIVSGSSAMSVGLPVGISLGLLVICVSIAIIILRWGVRNGYLRHVAWSYKLFRNSQEPVTFSTSEQDQETGVNVHI
ncbi:uncharacterized protein LOC112555283 isoform X1 [Pomacea canaliculata]|uniref:uncharacterized protein LOC112555283 isoform X1 n=1 Tax=Pomacea canaliculata TaxID=400727 RepID=UPI000D73FEF4|nr:uncharacterized protein LOC112555283 isoform X1 [Pomacea canaliculata]XP_025079403.1 uncharacterized protein LOC112555283 isoform X1 [Pomacea canaliculata]XP_025079404.1 uncharacterized protein LOC112555283 isoform X1 [Pomacea canaliculata]